jgi:septal ring factor EnvC (AmiA/AmiB activator)
MAMKHSPLTRGFFLRIALVAVLLPLGAALGGCSLFGIATKGNLEDLALQQDQQHQQLQSEVELAQQRMDGRVTQVEDKTRQLDQNLIRYETEIQAAKLQLQTILMDLEDFEESLVQASSESKQALRIQHEAILSERDRLRRRLNELDELILGWEQLRVPEPEGTITPVPGGLLVPEKELEQGTATSAEAAAEETSVWKDRRSRPGSR